MCSIGYPHNCMMCFSEKISQSPSSTFCLQVHQQDGQCAPWAELFASASAKTWENAQLRRWNRASLCRLRSCSRRFSCRAWARRSSTARALATGLPQRQPGPQRHCTCTDLSRHSSIYPLQPPPLLLFKATERLTHLEARALWVRRRGRPGCRSGPPPLCPRQPAARVQWPPAGSPPSPGPAPPAGRPAYPAAPPPAAADRRPSLEVSSIPLLHITHRPPQQYPGPKKFTHLANLRKNRAALLCWIGWPANLSPPPRKVCPVSKGQAAGWVGTRRGGRLPQAGVCPAPGPPQGLQPRPQLLHQPVAPPLESLHRRHIDRDAGRRRGLEGGQPLLRGGEGRATLQ